MNRVPFQTGMIGAHGTNCGISGKQCWRNNFSFQEEERVQKLGVSGAERPCRLCLEEGASTVSADGLSSKVKHGSSIAVRTSIRLDEPGFLKPFNM